MKRRRFTVTNLVFLLLSAAALLWIAGGRRWAESVIGRRLPGAVSARLGRPVTVGAVRLHWLLFHLTVEDVRVGGRALSDPPLFTARRWVLRPAPVFRGVGPATWLTFSLGRSDVEAPVLHAVSAGFLGDADARSGIFLWPTHTIHWTQGRFFVPVPAGWRPLFPEGLIPAEEGFLAVQPAGVAIDVAGDSSPTGPFALSAALRPGRGTGRLKVRGRLSLESFPLRTLAAWAPGSWDGKARGDVALEGVWSPGSPPPSPAVLWTTSSPWRWSVHVAGLTGSWAPDAAAAPIPFGGTLRASPGEVEVARGSLFDGLTFSGSLIQGASGGPEIKGRAKLAKFQLSDLGRLPFAGGRGFPWRGAADGEVEADGPWRSPRVKAAVVLTGAGVPGMSVPSARAEGQWEQGRLTAVGTLLGGRARVEARVGTPAPSTGTATARWEWTFEALDLAEAARFNHWGPVGGWLSATARVVRAGALSVAEGDLRVTAPLWGNHHSPVPVAGAWSWREGRFELKGGEGALRLSAQKTSTGWGLKELTFRNSQGLGLSAFGAVSSLGGEVNLTGTLSHLSLAEVPPWVGLFPRAEGFVDFSGTLSGPGFRPVFVGSVTVNDVRFAKTGPAHSLRARAQGDADQFEVAGLDLDGRWTGRGVWRAGEGWDMDLTARAAPLSLAAEVMGTTVPVAGDLSGFLRVQRWGGGLASSGEGRFDISEGRWGAFAFTRAGGGLGWEDGNARFAGWEIRQSAGLWRGDGAATWSAAPAKNRWTLDGRFQNFALSHIRLDGPVRGEGGFSVSPFVLRGAIDSPGLWVNGWGLGAGRMRMTASGKKADFSDITFGGAVKGRLAVDLESERLEGRFDVRSVPLSRWAPRFGFSPGLMASGTLAGSVAVDGSPRSPRVRFDTVVDDVDWNALGARARAAGVWEGGKLTLSSFTAVLSPSGEVEGGGTMTLGPDGVNRGDMVFSLRGIPLSNTLAALGLPSEVEGGVSGRLVWSGPALTADAVCPDVRWKGEGPFQARLRARWADRRVDVEEVSVTSPHGVWRIQEGSRLFLESSGGHFRLINDVRNVRMGPLVLFGGLEWVGRWSRGPSLSLEGRLRARSLWVNQRFIDEDVAQARWSGDRVVFTSRGGAGHLTGEVNLARWPQVEFRDLSVLDAGRRTLLLTGEWGPRRWEFHLDGWGLDAQALVGLADVDFPVTGKWDVSLAGRGVPGSHRVEGRVLGRDGFLGVFPYDRLESALFWDGPRVGVSNAEVYRRKGYRIRGSGTFPLTEDRRHDLRVEAVMSEASLAFLPAVWSPCRWARGSLAGELHARPGPDGPEVSGYLAVQNGELNAGEYVRTVKDINGRMDLAGNRVVIREASAKVGRGRAVLEGSVELDGVSPRAYDLHFYTAGRPGILVNAPMLAVSPGPLFNRLGKLGESLQGVSQGEPRVDLRIEGPRGNHRVSGTVILDDTRFTYPPVEKSGGRLPRNWWGELWREPTWDLLLRTGDETWFRNEYVNVRVNGELRVRGRRGAMRADGRVKAAEGAVSYLGQNFQVRAGQFEVVSDTRPDVGAGGVVPYLSGEMERSYTSFDAEGRPQDDVVTLVIPRAPLTRLQPRFVSRASPYLSSDRVAQKLLGISESDSSFTAAKREHYLRAGVVQMFGAAATPLLSSMAHQIGFTDIYPIYDAGSRPDADPGASAEAGRPKTLAEYLEGSGVATGVRLWKRVFGVYRGTYAQIPSTTRRQYYFKDEVELVYRVVNRLYLRLNSELDSERLLGQPPNRSLILENQWRFGWPRRKKKT
jgi:hypothetical protein